MKKYLLMLCLATPLLTVADEHPNKGKFEINQRNCNLPMDEIRRLLPDENERKAAIKHCMEKATKERWTRRTKLGENSH